MVLFHVLLFLFVFLLTEAPDAVFSVRVSRDPKATLMDALMAALVALHGLVLGGQVDAFTGLTVHVGLVLVSALGEGTGTGGELGLHGRVGGDPVGEGIFTVLDDTAHAYVSNVCYIQVRRKSYALLASYPS